MSARIVFDLDGTLIDSAPDIRRIASASLATLGAAPLSLEETRAFIGEGIETFVARMRAARDLGQERQAPLLADMTARYEEAHSDTVTYPGVPEVLARLAREYRLGICTNKLRSPCLKVLRHLGLAEHFGAITGGDNPQGRKPDPAPLFATLMALGEGPCLFVGDSEIDAETAERAGVPFLLFTEGYRKRPPERIPHAAQFDDFAALPGLVEALLGPDARAASGGGRGR
jgi:phosphoglycolate phosphatase